MDNQAALSGWAGDILVTVRGSLSQTEQVTWTYYHPHQQLVLRGKPGAEVTGFRGKEGTKTATPGYFLAYRPRIAQAMSAENPAAANGQFADAPDMAGREQTVRGEHTEGEDS